MNRLAIEPAYRRISVREFLAMDFGEAKAELIDGQIYMMAGGSERHAAIAANLIYALMSRLRGSGSRPYGSDLAARTGEATVRYPDVSVYCNREQLPPEAGNAKLIGDPKVIFEVLSPSTAHNDQVDKLAEYRELAGLDAVLFVDPERERVRLVQRSGAEGWTDQWLEKGAEAAIAALGIALPHEEIFAAG